jgi:hypothetical protein
MRRVNVSLDEETIRTGERVGKGNLSAGIRAMAERWRELFEKNRTGPDDRK